MIPRRVRLAVWIAFACHGLFILTGRYHLSYDAYTHMLFANHYAENWFSLWEPRWYAGFTVVSYPPLTHQLIALFVPLLGFDKAFALILWVVTTCYPLAVYAFARIFTSKTAASYAALASALLLPIYVTAYIFGQLPFLTSTLVALLAAASLNRYLREGGLHNFALTVALIATSMALHHATLMVQPFLVFAVTVNALVQNRLANLWLVFKRLLLFGAASIAAGLIVIYPFWQWGVTQTMQTPIDHISRHNFLTDPLAPAIFFIPLYGPLAVVIPFLFRKWPARFAGLLAAFAVLFLLGLGGTTPLPRLFFGPDWEWLTYDRFAFWASLTLTPFFGILLIRLRRKFRFPPRPVAGASLRKLILPLAFSLFAATALGSWFTPFIFPLQPAPIDMRPIVDFLNVDDHSQWRYLTFGFGDQFAYLNLLTTATTIDGSYHTARTIPELRASGIGQVDTALWTVKGISAIAPILKVSGSYGVRWGFVNRQEFIPELEKNGWLYRETLPNNIQVWEDPGAILPRPFTPPSTSTFASFAWGILPMLALVTASALGALRLYPTQAERVLRGVYAFVIGLLPFSLGLWIYRIVGEFSHPRVYFTYSDAIFFFSDGLMLFAVILWLTVKVAHASQNNRVPLSASPTSRVVLAFAALCLWASVGSLWSLDWRTSFYISLHWWLILLLVLSLRDWSSVWKSAMLGLSVALAMQIAFGLIGFGLQSTAFLKPLGLQWPGVIDPSTPGASVVQLANGERLLRAYGTLPHPNILGGFAFIGLLGPASLFLAGRKPNVLALILFGLGILLVLVTFSRSAWVALFFFLGILVWMSNHMDRKRVLLLFSTAILTIVIALIPMHNFVFVRVDSPQVATEQISSGGRLWLTQQALTALRAHPLTGMGLGSFVMGLGLTAPAGAPIEPVHNVVLLAAAELGMVGVLLFFGFVAAVVWNLRKPASPQAILASAALAGIGAISLFDHYFWTNAPGRIALGLALGLWIGQAVRHES